MDKMETKNELIIALHPPLRICWILPEVNYKWAKDVLLEYRSCVKKEATKRQTQR